MDLRALQRMEFYKKQKDWVFVRDVKKEKRILDETYKIEDEPVPDTALDEAFIESGEDRDVKPQLDWGELVNHMEMSGHPFEPTNHFFEYPQTQSEGVANFGTNFEDQTYGMSGIEKLYTSKTWPIHSQVWSNVGEEFVEVEHVWQRPFVQEDTYNEFEEEERLLRSAEMWLTMEESFQPVSPFPRSTEGDLMALGGGPRAFSTELSSSSVDSLTFNRDIVGVPQSSQVDLRDLPPPASPLRRLVRAQADLLRSLLTSATSYNEDFVEKDILQREPLVVRQVSSSEIPTRDVDHYRC